MTSPTGRGFSDERALRRARVRRWHGTSPAQLRERLPRAAAAHRA
ncbi:hypothetical protein ACRAWF_12600 [Streptomyces sp. L7]